MSYILENALVYSTLNPGFIAELLDFISMHYKYTGSSVAQKFLEKWPELLEQIVKVMPIDYKRVLMERQRHDEEIEAPVRSVPATA